jgi:4-hydroxy-2-oxoheptanedioate aldolase
MVEKKTAVEQLDEILEIDGVDMIQWGGSDYSMSVGMAGQRAHPDIKKVEKMVFEKALKAGKHPRAEIGSPDQAREYLDMGVRHFSIGTDISILYSFWQQNGDEMRKAMEGH